MIFTCMFRACNKGGTCIGIGSSCGLSRFTLWGLFSGFGLSRGFGKFGKNVVERGSKLDSGATCFSEKRNKHNVFLSFFTLVNIDFKLSRASV